MGDTGSLALGMALGLPGRHDEDRGASASSSAALFVAEALSVMLQVFHYKRTKKRLFLMAPLHHHFEKKGWSETKVVIRFWIVSGILATIGFSVYFAQSLGARAPRRSAMANQCTDIPGEPAPDLGDVLVLGAGDVGQGRRVVPCADLVGSRARLADSVLAGKRTADAERFADGARSAACGARVSPSRPKRSRAPTTCASRARAFRNSRTFYRQRPPREQAKW